MIVLYSIVLISLSIYSYTLVDPNMTLVNHPLWTNFRNYMVYWGYYRRDITSVIYVVLIGLLFVFHFVITRKYKKVNSLKLAGIIGFILLLSYPLLSHDFFNYLFDAKIFTFYHQNPYLHKALDFPHDPWLRFMHWTHRTYPYGPVFLIITLIPSFLSFGKLILAYSLFKVLFIGAYIVSVYYLNKLNKKWAVMFATHPVVIMEGLLNLHNDLIGVCLAVVGFYYLIKNKQVKARIFLLASAGIKYLTFPLLFISKKDIRIQYIVLAASVGVVGYLSLTSEVQPWYFLTFFALLPFFDDWVARCNIFFAGILLAYYPYIRFGGWDKPEYVNQKHVIIVISLVLNLLYLAYLYLPRKISKRNI